MAPRRLWAGLVLACLCAGARGETVQTLQPALPAECLNGFAAQEPSRPAQAFAEEAPSDRLPPGPQQWLTTQHWQAGYSLWQRCRSGLGSADPAICGEHTTTQALCQGPQDGLAFLAMHRHLLHSVRAAWPSYQELWTSWRRVPERSDYPPDLHSAFTPWPSAVMRAAQAVDNLRSMPRAQLLARWPSEGAFGQWLQCGSGSAGMAVDSLYGALLANSGLHLSPHKLDSRTFWRHHAWIDRAWDAYRKKLGKTPDDPQLQALLLQQCQQHSRWAQRAAQLKLYPPPALTPSKALFVRGELNPDQAGTWLSVVGEVAAVQRDSAGHLWVKLDLRLLAAKPLWFTSDATLVGIQPGDRLRVAGYLQPAARRGPNGPLDLPSPGTLWVLAESMQSLR